MTIAEKYNAKKGTTIKDALELDLDSDDEEVIRPRGRLMQGSRPVAGRPLSSSPPPAQTRPRNRLAKKAVITIDSDSDGEDQEGSEDDFDEQTNTQQANAPEDTSGRMEEIRDERLLKLFNECTVHDLAELSGHSDENIQYVLDQRPFVDLDHVRGIVMETLTKTGKKSKRVRQVGEKLVDDCIEVMTGYDAVDELVVKCEEIAKPLQEALKAWGVDKTDGELQIMKLDEPHDSGIGTPSSTCTADDAPAQKSQKSKGKFLGQPANMNPEMVMKDYQLVGLNWLNLLYDRKLSCILADDMGLGKTCQIIGFLSHLQMKKVDGVHLIIVPGSTLENWLREFGRFAPNLSVRPYYGGQKEREELRYQLEADFAEIDVVVTTYDMATGDADNHFLRHFGPYSVCVYDEAHMLRNPKSKRYRQLMRIGADFKVLLTGTPLQNNLQELVAILAFIMPDLFLEKSEDLEYIFKHKASTKDTAHAALLSSERIARARTMMTPFILRRKKHQVLDLPKKVSRVEWCDMSDTQANLYADVISEAQEFFTEKANGTVKGQASRSSNVIMSLRKAAIHPLLSRRIYDDKKIDKIVGVLSRSEEFGANTPEKIRAYIDGSASDQVVKGGDFAIHRFCYDRDYLRKKFALKRQEWMDSGKVEVFKDLIQRWAANGDRVLVFSQFTTAMDILEAVLDTLDVKFMRLDGQTKMDIRQDMIDTFTNDPSIPVFMLSTKAGGAGINLAAANKVIIFDSGFNPQDDIQAENRAHRVGQTRDVEVVRLVTKGTIEEQIHALGESKLALDERVAGEAASAAESSSAEKEGEKLVEEMLVKQIKGEEKKDDGEKATDVKEEKTEVQDAGDLKDAFKKGLEGEGLKIESKQAQY
jgi:SWI/SNF-related matrix-associated actin-dependent regulator 1 of chromatin subfamily A